MTAGRFNICFIFISLSCISQTSHGFEVNQPASQTVNPDGSAVISCEHNANANAIIDARLYGISPGGRSLLCQKGQKNCSNITMYAESANRWLFVLLHVGPEAMNLRYQCQITVNLNALDVTKEGATPTTLLPGPKEAPCVLQSPPPAPPAPPPPPPPPASPLLRWVLIGLLVLMSVYGCILTCLYVRLRCSDTDPENSTYVEMRKAPQPRVHPRDVYCG